MVLVAEVVDKIQLYLDLLVLLEELILVEEEEVHLEYLQDHTLLLVAQAVQV